MSSSACPNCGHSLSPSERSEGWCDSCGKRLPGALSVASPAPSAGKEARPLGPAVYRSDMPGALSWGTVRAGLGQTMVGVALLTLFLIGALIAVNKQAPLGRPNRGAPPFAELLVIGIVAVALVGGVLSQAGMCMTCAAPEGARGRGATVGVVLFLALQVLLLLAVVFANAENDRVARDNLKRALESDRFDAPLDRPVRRPVERPSPFGPLTLTVLRLAFVAAGCLEMVFFLLFLRGTALTFQRHGLAVHLLIFLLLYVVLAALTFALALALETSSEWLPASEGPHLVTGGLGAGIVVALWLLGLVFAVRRAITQGLGG